MKKRHVIISATQDGGYYIQFIDERGLSLGTRTESVMRDCIFTVQQWTHFGKLPRYRQQPFSDGQAENPQHAEHSYPQANKSKPE